MSENRRVTIDWLGTRALLYTLLLLAPLALLSGCGSGQTGSGQSNTVPVNLAVSFPQNTASVASTSTIGSRVWAVVQRWLPTPTSAWAQSATQIASIRVVARGGGTLLQSTTVPVENPTSGQIVTVQLNVPSGLDRSFSVSVMNGATAVLFSGCVTGVNLTPGVPVAVTITLVAGGGADCTGLTRLKVTTLGSGAQLEGPLAGIRVLRQNPSTGAVLGDVVTDNNGVADFGEIGTTRTTLSWVTTRSDGRKVVVSFLNIGVGNLKINLARIFDAITPPPQTTGSVTITSVPALTTQINLNSGGFEGTGSGLGGQQLPILLPDLPVVQLQSDGLVSFLAEARDANGTVLGCSQALDRNPLPSPVLLSLPIDIQSPPPLVTTYTSLTEEVVRVAGTSILRKGVVFDLFRNLSGTFSAGPIPFTHCGIQNAEQASISFRTNEAANGFRKTVEIIHNVTGGFPSNVSFSLPDLALNSLARNGLTTSWTTSGSALSQTDFAALELRWQVGQTDYEWDVVADPLVASITLPQLPPDLADRIPPPINVGLDLDLGGVNNVAGFGDLGNKFFAVGEFDVNVKFAGATEYFEVRRSIGLVIVNLALTGGAQGTVTSTSGGIDCPASCAATFPGGSLVTLTATAATLSDQFAGFSFPCNGNPQGPNFNPCTITLDGNQQEITATFNRP
jgi:hypothetical protein